MKFITMFLALALLTDGSAWAAKKKKKKKKAEIKAEVIVTDGYDLPCLYGDNGTLNKDFFDEFKLIVNKSTQCTDGAQFEGDDPVWKARMYLTQMKKLATDMPLLIAVDAADYNINHLKDLHIKLDKKVEDQGKTSTLDVAAKILGFAGPYGAAAKTALEGLSFAMKMMDKYDNMKKPKYDLNGDVTSQMRGVQDERNMLIKRFQRLRHSFEDIVAALDGNENDIKDLTPENQEILRATVCRFSPPKDGIVRYTKFCSSVHGGEDFNALRGTASCADVHAVTDKNLPLVKRTLKANFANSIAQTVQFHDRSNMHPDGHAARFEINVESKPAVFAAPGGNQLLCQILQDPKYDKYWSEGSPRKLLDTMTVIDAGFPVIYRLPISKWTSGGGDFWYYAVPEKDHWKKGDAKKWNVKYAKMGDSAEVRSTNGAQDYIHGLKENVRNPTIREIVKGECDREY